MSSENAATAARSSTDGYVVSEFRKRWLQGSTCHRHKRTVHWLSDDERFVVMKHHGHTEYVDRVSGSMRCGTYFALYDLMLPMPDALGKPCVWVVDGRWLQSHRKELELQVATARAAT